MSVYEKLLTVQKKLNAPKSKFNKFGGYNYRSCEDILDGVKPLLVEVQATLFLTDDVVQIAERIYVKTTAKFIDIESGEFVENTAFAREPLAVKGMNDSQITGASSTYARKYCLNGLFCIDDTVDEDSSETTDEERKKATEEKKQADKAVAEKQKADKEALAKQEHEAQLTDEQKNQEMIDSVDKDLIPKPNEKISDAQLGIIKKEMERTGINMKTILYYAKTKTLEEMSQSTAVAIIDQLAKTKDKDTNNG